MSGISIMVDPGHNYATYNQSPVVPAYYEGRQMWKLSNFLRLALTAKGFKTDCTKDQCNQTVSVTQRGRMAKGHSALISLHSNAASSKLVDYPCAIYFVDDDCGKIDLESQLLAKRLSNVVENIMGTKQKAKQWSQKSSLDRDGDGKLNDDYYGVLYAAHQAGVPAIILECSFHTNRDAANWLLNDANLRKLAASLADELADYYGVEAPKPINKKEGQTVDLTVKVLRKGDKNDDVKALQAMLTGYGYEMTNNGKTYGIDGSFGTATENALKDCQRKNGWEVDGVCGPECWTGFTKGKVKLG